MKKVGKYCILTILLLLGLCCVGILYLFFVPGSSLFGICYITYSEYHSSTPYNKDTISSIVLNSNSYDVKIVSSEDDDISVTVYSNSLGFVLTKNKSTIISHEKENNVLTFDITEPTGLALKNSSYIELKIPTSKEFNLTLKNNNAKTVLNNADIQIKNLTYKTNNGNCTIDNANISDTLKLNIGKSIFTISSSVETNLNNVILDVNTGKFNAAGSKFNNITINSNTRGTILIGECANITQETSTAGGRIEIEKATFANIKSSSTNVYIKQITDGAIIDLSANGNVTIDEITGENSHITTFDGNITIKTANSSINLKTNTGNATIYNANEHVDVETKYGTVEVSFTEDATNKYLSASLSDGMLISTGLEKINLIVSSNGRANISMSDVKGLSSIEGKSGSIFVKINKNSRFKLTTASEGSVRVNLAQIPQYGGYTTKESTTTYVNCSESTHDNNVLEVSTTSGGLTVLDSNFA